LSIFLSAAQLDEKEKIKKGAHLEKKKRKKK